ncbi:MAG TPA: efflux RND transporter periplasmic adaptor subunit [Syntrophales bacterium]|nr:efflux RND transporter periplasmic adaptor subunit [Syntrophales bacterium]
MKKRVRIILLVILVIAAAAGIYTYTFRTENNSNRLTISGNIEITEVPLSFKIAGRLAERLVDEGDSVKKGQIIARLERVDQERMVAREEAGLAQVEAMLAELEAGSRPQEIANVQAELKRAEAAARIADTELRQAKADYERFSELLKVGGTSQRDFELHETRYKAAQSANVEAEALVVSFRERLDLVKEGPRKETIKAAQARVNVARQGLALAHQQLADTELSSPIDGMVLNKSAEVGAYLVPGMPVVTVGDMDRPWLRAYVNETDVGRLQLGQTVEVVTDSLPEKQFPGRISFISSEAEFTPKTVQTFEERVKLMYRIKIDLENPEHHLKPGMPADAILEGKE